MPYTTEDLERDLSDDNTEGRTESLTITLPIVSWPQLRGEKHVLMQVMAAMPITDPQYITLEGLLNFVEAIQDVAADQLGSEFAEEHIFFPRDDE